LLNNIQTSRSLGKGAFGKVYICKYNPNGGKYAVKFFDIVDKGKSIESAKIEMKILEQIQHKNVVRLIG